MSVSVVLFTSVGHEPGFEAWCDQSGSVAELTEPLSAGDDGVDEASACVERAALLHEDNDHAAIGWDDEPVLLRTLPVVNANRTTSEQLQSRQGRCRSREGDRLGEGSLNSALPPPGGRLG